MDFLDHSTESQQLAVAKIHGTASWMFDMGLRSD